MIASGTREFSQGEGSETERQLKQNIFLLVCLYSPVSSLLDYEEPGLDFKVSTVQSVSVLGTFETLHLFAAVKCAVNRTDVGVVCFGTFTWTLSKRSKIFIFLNCEKESRQAVYLHIFMVFRSILWLQYKPWASFSVCLSGIEFLCLS